MPGSAFRPLSPPTPTCAGCPDEPASGAGVGRPRQEARDRGAVTNAPGRGKPRPATCSSSSVREPARLIHTLQDRPRAGVCSSLTRMFTATHCRRGQLAAAGGHPWSWTEVVQTFRSWPDDCRMSWTAQTERRGTVRAEKVVHGSDQQGCSPGRPAEMITDHVPAVRVPPDHTGHSVAAAARVQWVVATLLLGILPGSTIGGGKGALRAAAGQAGACPVVAVPRGAAEAPGSRPAAGRRAAMRSSLDAGGAGPGC